LFSQFFPLPISLSPSTDHCLPSQSSHSQPFRQPTTIDPWICHTASSGL
jgi:hypothetical protein